MNNIGVAIITFNRPDYYKKVLDNIPKNKIKCLVIVNDGKTPYANESDGDYVIKNNEQLGVSISKNKALKILIEKFNCEHLFLIEDDVLIQNENVFDEYINTANTFGIHHLNYEKVAGNEKTLKYSYKAPSGHSIGLYHNPQGAFSYFNANIIKKLGYFDENYINAFEHIDIEYSLSKNNVAPNFWYFPDVLNSDQYLKTIEGSDENSTITNKNKYQENWQKSAQTFVKKWGHFTNEIPDVGEETIKNRLMFLESNYAKKKLINCDKKLSIIIPYRDRKPAVDLLIPKLFDYVSKQVKNFNISIIEQSNKKLFNKGLLNNIGFLINEKSDYFCFHDVDLIPEFSDYSYPETPSHLSSHCSQFNYVNIPDKIMGGVITFNKENYKNVNGYSNLYEGWGKEDDDLYERCLKSNLTPYKHPFGRYYSVPHIHRLNDIREQESHKQNGERFWAFQRGETDHLKDGINNMPLYKIIDKKSLDFNTIWYKIDT
jgi:hypothetical protein